MGKFMSDQPGELYFLGERELGGKGLTGFVKVGIVRASKTRSTADRIDEHQTGNARLIEELAVLTTPDVTFVEATIHDLFATWRVGGEWFDLRDERLGEVLDTSREIIATVSGAASQLDEAKRLSGCESDGTLLPASPLHWEIGRQVALARYARTVCKGLEADLGALLTAEAASGQDVTTFIDLQVVRKKPALDKASFQRDNPDTYESYCRATPTMSNTFTPSRREKFGIDASSLDTPFRELADEIKDMLSSFSPGSNPKAIHRKFLHLLRHNRRFELQDRVSTAELKVACGTHLGIEGVCTWKRTLGTKVTFDETAFASDHPDLYETYLQRPDDIIRPVLNRTLGRNLD